MSGGDWKEMLVAVQDGDFDLVKYHIESGVDPNYEHPELMTTALIESIEHDQLEIAKFLLDHGANPKQNAWLSNDNPIKVARRSGKQAFVQLMKRYAPKRFFWN